MKDEIAKEIIDELRLIREELQNLTMAIRSKTSNSENAYSGKSRKSYQARSANLTILDKSVCNRCEHLPNNFSMLLSERNRSIAL